MDDYLSQIYSVYQQYPQRSVDIIHSISPSQYRSKQWLVEEMVNWVTEDAPTILIVGGWYGTYLIPMLKEKYKDCSIIFTDKDPLTVEIASVLHKKQKGCTFETHDTHNVKKKYKADVLINTSCEHMIEIGHQALTNPSTCLYVLQSCDDTLDEGHINTAASTPEFVRKCGLTTEFFQARTDLGHKNRFMVIGYK